MLVLVASHPSLEPPPGLARPLHLCTLEEWQTAVGCPLTLLAQAEQALLCLSLSSCATSPASGLLSGLVTHLLRCVHVFLLLWSPKQDTTPALSFQVLNGGKLSLPCTCTLCCW